MCHRCENDVKTVWHRGEIDVNSLRNRESQIPLNLLIAHGAVLSVRACSNPGPTWFEEARTLAQASLSLVRTWVEPGSNLVPTRFEPGLCTYVILFRTRFEQTSRKFCQLRTQLEPGFYCKFSNESRSRLSSRSSNHARPGSNPVFTSFKPGRGQVAPTVRLHALNLRMYVRTTTFVRLQV